MDRFETRKNGCDIIPPVPEAEMLEGKAEKAKADLDAEPDAEEDFSVDGGKTGKDSSGMLSLAGTVLCTVGVLWIFSMSSPFLAASVNAHGWRLWACIAAGLVPPLAVVAAITAAVLKFRKIPKVEQFDFSPGQVKSRLQRKVTEKYLSKFPDPEKYAGDNGYSKENGAYDLAVSYMRRLTGKEDARYSDAAGWISDFGKFNALQKERAGEIVSRAWKRTWLSTSASPWKIVDMICVLHHSTAMIVSIGKIFNRRIPSRAAFRLAARWALNIYISGEIGELASKGTDSAVAGWKESLSSWLGTAVKPLASVVGKAAEGGVNAFLVNRLGRKAVSYFDPVAGRTR